MRRLFAQKAATEGCWDWPNYRNKDGYGLTSLNGKTTVAHRVAWVLTFDSIPDNLYVLHRCDNPACCNPSHLFLGTAEDNAKDCKSKGRHARGERNGIAKSRTTSLEQSALMLGLKWR